MQNNKAVIKLLREVGCKI